MKCKIRACMSNDSEECQKYSDVEDMVKDFDKGGGCVFTWFFTGQIPKGEAEK